MEALEPDLVEALFRFALLLNGRRSVAVDLVCKVVAEAEARSAQWREGEHRFHWALHRLRMEWEPSALPDGAPPGSETYYAPDVSDSSEVPVIVEVQAVSGLKEFLEALDPQARACAALELSCSLPDEAVARVLSENPRAVRRFRKEWGVRLASPELFGTWKDRIGEWLLSDPEKERLQHAVQSAPPVRHRFERFLGWAAVLTGALALGGWFGWEHWSDSEQTRVQTNLEQLLEGADGWKQVEWKTFDGHPGEVEDWLFLNGLEGARFPARLAQSPPTAGRVVQWREARVAQVIASQPKSLIWIVPARAAGAVSSELQSGSVRSGRWSGNWTMEGSYLVLVAAMDPSG